MWILLSGDTLEEPHREKKTNKTKHSTRVKFLKSAASVLGRKTVGWFYEYHVLFWFSPQSEFEFEEKLFHSCLASGCAFWEFVKCSPTGCFLLIQKKKKKKAHLISWALDEIVFLLISIVPRSLLAYLLGRCCLRWMCTRAHTITNTTFILRGNFISFLVTCPLIFHSSGLTNTDNFLN